jgi:hypothetical protein
MKILILPFNRWTRHRVVAGSFVCGEKPGKSRVFKALRDFLLIIKVAESRGNTVK